MPRPHFARFAHLLFWLPFAAASSAGLAANSAYNVRTFGASGDGKTLDTDAIN
jgi:hypothetical protein